MKKYVDEVVKNCGEGRTTLVAAGKSFDAIEGLEKCSKLLNLKLGGNLISKVQNLQNLVSLATLDLSSNKISKIEGLQDLKKLTQLDLFGNSISVIQNLSALLDLTKLDLSSNNISKIEGLSKLTNLKKLKLGSNSISRIENLHVLVNLTSLTLSFNQISKIEGLQTLTKIKTLKLDHNSISKIQNLHLLVNLTKLEIDKNDIKVIEGLEGNTLLQRVGLYGNPIEMIVCLQQFRLQSKKFVFANIFGKKGPTQKMVEGWVKKGREFLKLKREITNSPKKGHWKNRLGESVNKRMMKMDPLKLEEANFKWKEELRNDVIHLDSPKEEDGENHFVDSLRTLLEEMKGKIKEEKNVEHI